MRSAGHHVPALVLHVCSIPQSVSSPSISFLLLSVDLRRQRIGIVGFVVCHCGKGLG